MMSLSNITKGKKKNNLLVFCAFFCYLIAFQSDSNENSAYLWTEWQQVGKAKLTWGFWTIYDSELLSPNGKFNQFRSPLALMILYNKDIDAKELLKATKEQWQHLGFSQRLINKWDLTMQNAWPNVKKGDKLIYLYQGSGQIYFKQKGKPPVLYSELKDALLAKAFIEIWLSPNTAYPKLRRGLLNID